MGEVEAYKFFGVFFCSSIVSAGGVTLRGERAEINKIFDEMKAFMEDKEIIQSWYAYWGMMDTDSPALVSVASAKNIREFREENAKAWDSLGREAGKIKQKMMK